MATDEEKWPNLREPLNASAAEPAPAECLVVALDKWFTAKYDLFGCDDRGPTPLSVVERRRAEYATAKRELADALEALIAKTPINVRAVFGDVAPGKVREG